MKKLFYLAMLMLSAASLYAADFKFAENGKTDYVIAIPEKLAKFDRQAADELRYYLGNMSGADFNIVRVRANEQITFKAFHFRHGNGEAKHETGQTHTVSSRRLASSAQIRSYSGSSSL